MIKITGVVCSVSKMLEGSTRGSCCCGVMCYLTTKNKTSLNMWLIDTELSKDSEVKYKSDPHGQCWAHCPAPYKFYPLIILFSDIVVTIIPMLKSTYSNLSVRLCTLQSFLPGSRFSLTTHAGVVSPDHAHWSLLLILHPHPVSSPKPQSSPDPGRLLSKTHRDRKSGSTRGDICSRVSCNLCFVWSYNNKTIVTFSDHGVSALMWILRLQALQHA